MLDDANLAVPADAAAAADAATGVPPALVLVRTPAVTCDAIDLAVGMVAMVIGLAGVGHTVIS